jgi:hypothetical protein
VKVKNLKNLQIEESPGQTTAGLTSANQLVNMTDAVSFEPSNTSSGISEPIIAAIDLPKLPQCATPTDIFRDALRSTMRHQGKILDVLANL